MKDNIVVLITLIILLVGFFSSGIETSGEITRIPSIGDKQYTKGWGSIYGKTREQSQVLLNEILSGEKGDVNSDGKIDEHDCVLVGQIYSRERGDLNRGITESQGKNTGGHYWERTQGYNGQADINDDGRVTIDDVRAICQAMRQGPSSRKLLQYGKNVGENMARVDEGCEIGETTCRGGIRNICKKFYWVTRWEKDPCESGTECVQKGSGVAECGERTVSGPTLYR